MRVAIVDDDVSLAAILTEFLSEEGYQVACWHESGSALSGILTFAPAVIILDTLIGGAEIGLSILEELRSDPHTAQTPVIVTSSNDWLLRESRVQLRDLRASTLAKPFDLEALLEHIEAALRATP